MVEGETRQRAAYEEAVEVRVAAGSQQQIIPACLRTRRITPTQPSPIRGEGFSIRGSQTDLSDQNFAATCTPYSRGSPAMKVAVPNAPPVLPASIR